MEAGEVKKCASVDSMETSAAVLSNREWLASATDILELYPPLSAYASLYYPIGLEFPGCITQLTWHF